MTYTEKINLIHRFLSNELNPNEMDVFNVWLKADSNNKILFDQISNIWEASTSRVSNIKFDAEKAYLKHNKRLIKENVLLSEDSKIRTIGGRYQFSRLQMMAAIMILVIASVLVINFNNGEKINAENTKLVTLDDGSKIWLEKGTQLNIREVSKKERKVSLNGKAYFEIVENKAVPFHISTDEFTVKVMGTRFIVDSKGSSVNVRDGKVLITSQKKQLILLADQSVKIKSNIPLVAIEQAFDNKALWFNEELTFDNTPFDIVIRDLAINYKVSIELPNKNDWSSCTFTSGSLKKNGLDEVFTILKLTYDIEYKKTSDDTYTITRVKCK